MFIHVTAVEYLEDYKLHVRFNTGEEGIVDLEPELYGAIFEPLRDKALFQQVALASRTIEWPNGADFAPEFLLEIAQEPPGTKVRKHRGNALSKSKKPQAV